MRIKTLLLSLLCAVAALAQPAGSVPEDGQTYYIYNVGRGGYLSANDTLLTYGDTPIAVTLSSADATLSTVHMTSTQGRLSVTPLVDMYVNGAGTYDEWIITPVDGMTNVYTIAYRWTLGSSYPFLYASWLLNDVVGLPYVPDLLRTNGMWIFVTPDEYAEGVVTLDELSTVYATPDLSNMGGSATVHLKRSFSLDCWNSFCVPFDIDATQLANAFGTDMRVAQFTGFSDNTIHFVCTDRVEAGVPYLIYPTKAPLTDDYYVFTGVTSFADAPQSITHDGYTYTGSFVNQTSVPAGSYVLRKNQLYHTVSAMSMKGFRGYLHATGTDSKAIDWTLDGATTAIDGVTVGDSNEPNSVYTIGGQAVGSDVQGRPAGVYVVNGKKVVIK